MTNPREEPATEAWERTQDAPLHGRPPLISDAEAATTIAAVETSRAPIAAINTSRAIIDAENQRHAILRAMTLGVWVWPLFIAVDVFMQLAFYPEAPTWHYLALRFVEEGILLYVYWLARAPRGSAAALSKAQNLAFSAAALFIALMALDFGGLNSTYVHGISLAMLIHCVVVAAPVSLQLRALVPMALTFPVVTAVAAAFSPEIRASFLDRDSVLRFLSNYVFVLASGMIGAIASRTVWTTQMQLYQARKLGRYRLEAPIGEGGMNEIWLAWDDGLRRNVALKLLRSTGRPDSAAVLRFEQEAYAASKLNDPHTIRIFDFGASDDGIYYIAMEYLRGIDLARLVREHGRLPVPRALRFARQACTSLIEAHEAGIIHRDIKPHNLFVTCVGGDHDFLKLLDFGVARVVSSTMATLTTTGNIYGTPAFMAPEACRGEPADARSDVYSLGATLYFLLTGAPPFEGVNIGQLFVAHLTQDPIPPGRVREEQIAEGVDALVLRCLAKDPSLRFQTAHELQVALEALPETAAWTERDAARFWQTERDAREAKMRRTQQSIPDAMAG